MMRWFPLAAAVLIVVLFVGVYRAKTEAEARRASVARLHRENAETEAHIRALRAEVAALESPARLETLARRALGLEPGRAAQSRPESAMARALPAPAPREEGR